MMAYVCVIHFEMFDNNNWHIRIIEFVNNGDWSECQLRVSHPVGQYKSTVTFVCIGLIMTRLSDIYLFNVIYTYGHCWGYYNHIMSFWSVTSIFLKIDHQ